MVNARSRAFDSSDILGSERKQRRLLVKTIGILGGISPQATERFINGDPALWKKIASQRDDATIMGAWGAFEKGWNEVGPRYDWAAARFKPSGAQLKVEYLASSVSGDLAYIVAIERSTALIVGQDKPAPLALRVTHVFRKENGAWRLVHRQADPLTDSNFGND